MLKKLLVLFCIAAALVIMTARYGSLSAEESFHTPDELAFFRGVADTLPNDTNSFFWSSGKCAGCHGYAFFNVCGANTCRLIQGF